MFIMTTLNQIPKLESCALVYRFCAVGKENKLSLDNSTIYVVSRSWTQKKLLEYQVNKTKKH